MSNPEIHTTYREILNANIPKTVDEAIGNSGWKELRMDQTVFHGSEPEAIASLFLQMAIGRWYLTVREIS